MDDERMEWVIGGWMDDRFDGRLDVTMGDIPRHSSPIHPQFSDNTVGYFENKAAPPSQSPPIISFFVCFFFPPAPALSHRIAPLQILWHQNSWRFNQTNNALSPPRASLFLKNATFLFCLLLPCGQDGCCLWSLKDLGGRE